MNLNRKSKPASISFQMLLALFFGILLLRLLGIEINIVNEFLIITLLFGVVAALTGKVNYKSELDKVNPNTAFKTFLPCFFIATLVRYLPIVLYNYMVIPGDDQYFHALLSNLIVEHGSVDVPFVWTSRGLTSTSAEYPLAFHILVAILSQIMQIGILDLYLLLAPSLISLSMLAIYFYAKESFGNKVALFSSILFGLLSYSPSMTFWDGGYPNLMGANFFFIIGLTFYLKIFKQGGNIYGVLAGVFFAATMLTHAFSAVYMILIVTITSSIFMILDASHLSGRDPQIRPLAIVIAFIFFLGLIPSWRFYFDFLINPVWRMFSGQASLSVALEGGQQTPLRLGLYPEYVGPMVIYLGILGVIFLISKLRQESPRKERDAFFLLLWLLVMFVSSRTSSSFLPLRFTRDLAAPLSISAGLFLSQQLFIPSQFSRKLTKNPEEVARGNFWSLSKLSALLLIGLLLFSLYNASTYALQRNKLVRLNPEIYDAIEWLRGQKNGTVLTSPFMELPVTVLSGHQTITPGAQPKDFLYRLNPNDREVAENAWHILDYPDDRDTFIILRTYRIDYLFLLKKIPYYWGPSESVFVNYERFKESLFYTVLFENLETIILTPNNERIEEFLNS